MTEAEIIEANKVIAGFMNGEYCEYPGDYFPGEYGYQFKNFNPNYNHPNATSTWWNENSLAFHKSWNWLMPVGKKIFDYLQSEIKKRPPHTCTQGDLLEVNITCAIREYDIVKAHEYIFQWIQWYNTQTESNAKDKN